ncbi:DDB1- and CUL4-associated factor 4 [Crotalus adamanteus]|uniref:DDB1- and CUL4-associated factor 4 n=1 Tax=Crotalus adamanteus TaxID=8729 RepID=A0AAW1C714_CROAD
MTSALEELHPDADKCTDVDSSQICPLEKTRNGIGARCWPIKISGWLRGCCKRKRSPPLRVRRVHGEEMKRNRWQDRRNHEQHNHRRIRNTQPYMVFHHQHSTERPEQRELQSLQNSGRSQTESPSASSHSRQSSSVPELPGFYYDPEKNRYFRLLPGHNNCNPLTKEGIHQKEMERQRLKLLKEDEKMVKKTPRSGLNSSIILRKKQLGFYSSITYCRLIHELKVNCMQRRKLEIENLNSSVSGSNNFKLIVADTASERIITVSEAERGGCKYGIVDLSGLGKNSLTVEMCDNPCFTNRKVNSVCWASLSHLDSHVLYPCY